MTVIVHLKGEEGRKHLEAEAEKAEAFLKRASQDMADFERDRKPPKWWEARHPNAMFQPQHRVTIAKSRYDSLLAQLALFDKFPQQAEVVLKEG